MMDTPLTLDWIADRAERWMADGEVVSRRPDRSITRTTYGALIPRARRLARALVAAGVKPGDRIATLMWNHAEHLEAYFGIPLATTFSNSGSRQSSTITIRSPSSFAMNAISSGWSRMFSVWITAPASGIPM